METPNTGLNDLSDTTVTIILVYNKISTIDTHSEISLRAVNAIIEADRSTGKRKQIQNSVQAVRVYWSIIWHWRVDQANHIEAVL